MPFLRGLPLWAPPASALWSITYNLDFTALPMDYFTPVGSEIPIDLPDGTQWFHHIGALGQLWNPGAGEYDEPYDAANTQLGGANGLHLRAHYRVTHFDSIPREFSWFASPSIADLLALFSISDTSTNVKVSASVYTMSRALGSYPNGVALMIDANALDALTGGIEERHEFQVYGPGFGRLLLGTTASSPAYAADVGAVSDCIKIEIPVLGEDTTVFSTGTSVADDFPGSWTELATVNSGTTWTPPGFALSDYRASMAVNNASGSTRPTTLCDWKIKRFRMEVSRNED